MSSRIRSTRLCVMGALCAASTKLACVSCRSFVSLVWSCILSFYRYSRENLRPFLRKFLFHGTHHDKLPRIIFPKSETSTRVQNNLVRALSIVRVPQLHVSAKDTHCAHPLGFRQFSALLRCRTHNKELLPLFAFAPRGTPATGKFVDSRRHIRNFYYKFHFAPF